MYKLVSLIVLLCVSHHAHAQGITFEVVIDDVVYPAGCGVGGYIQLATESEPTLVSGALTVLGGKLSYTIVGPDGRRTVVSSETGQGSWNRSVGLRTIESNTIIRIPLFLFSWNGALLFADPGTYKLIVAADILQDGSALADSVLCAVGARGIGYEQWEKGALQCAESLATPFGVANLTYDRFLTTLDLPTDSTYREHARYFFAYQYGKTAVPRLMGNATSISSASLATLPKEEYAAAIAGGRAIAEGDWGAAELWTYLQVLFDQTFGTPDQQVKRSKSAVEWWLK